MTSVGSDMNMKETAYIKERIAAPYKNAFIKKKIKRKRKSC